MNCFRVMWRGCLALLSAAGLVGAVEVSEGPVVEAEENSAVVRWTTDVECGTTLIFGTNAEALTRRAAGDVGRKHQVSLDGLQPGTVYHFRAGTAKRLLVDGRFQTKGTAPSAANPAPKPPSLLDRIFGKKPPQKPSEPPPEKTSPAASPQTSPHPAASQPKPPKPPSPAAPPPARQTWGDLDTLQDHFVRHGRDFRAQNADDYAARAWLFLQRAIDEGLPVKQDAADGTLRIWDPHTQSFAAYNRDFTTKTYFKPRRPDYFQRQPGRLVKLRRPAAKP